MGKHVRQTSYKPTRKVAAGTAVGTPLAVVIAWGAGELGIDMPLEVAVAVGALISQAVSWFTKERA